MPLEVLHIHRSRNRELPCNDPEPTSEGRVDNTHHKKLQRTKHLARLHEMWGAEQEKELQC
jgi:hypothetical protein